jgi:hypothetical protein
MFAKRTFVGIMGIPLLMSRGNGHIGYDDVVPLLMAACPSHAGSRECASVEEGEFVRVLGFVRHLIRLLHEGRVQSFTRVFGVVEWILADGEPAAIDLIQAGFLADLTDPEVYQGTSVRLADFGPWLGARARGDPEIRRLLGDEAP